MEDLYFNETITKFKQIFVFFESDELFMLYPGGSIYNMLSFNAHSRAWYNKTKYFYDTTEDKDSLRE